MRPLSVALQKKAEKEVNETPQKLRCDLDVLRDWISQRPRLGSIQLPVQWLVSILRCTKYDLKKAKNKLEKYFNLKDIIPEFYTNRYPFDPKIQELLKLGLVLPVRNLEKEDANRVCLIRVAELPKTKYSLSDLIKVGFMIAEILLLEDDNFTVAGTDIIADLDKTGFLLLTQWTPFLARKSLICAEGALAVRIRSLNVINSPRGINAAITIFRMFLTTKLKNRIRVFGHNYEGLFESVPESVFPAEYGGSDGNLKDLTADQWLVSILRGTKYDLNKAKNKLEKYWSLKNYAPEFYTNRDPFDPKIQELLKLGLFLPVRNVVKEDSPRVCLVQAAQLPKTQYTLVDMIKISLMIIEILILEDDNFSVAGIDIISNLDKCGFLVLTQWNPFLARKSLKCGEGALAVRIKTLNSINSPRGINAAITIFRMFLTAKLRNRIQVFGHNYEGLYEFVNEGVLPAEFGGKDGSLKDLTDYWKAKVESYRDWFLRQEI